MSFSTKSCWRSKIHLCLPFLPSLLPTPSPLFKAQLPRSMSFGCSNSWRRLLWPLSMRQRQRYDEEYLFPLPLFYIYNAKWHVVYLLNSAFALTRVFRAPPSFFNTVLLPNPKHITSSCMFLPSSSEPETASEYLSFGQNPQNIAYIIFRFQRLVTHLQWAFFELVSVSRMRSNLVFCSTQMHD